MVVERRQFTRKLWLMHNTEQQIHLLYIYKREIFIIIDTIVKINCTQVFVM